MSRATFDFDGGPWVDVKKFKQLKPNHKVKLKDQDCIIGKYEGRKDGQAIVNFEMLGKTHLVKLEDLQMVDS